MKKKLVTAVVLTTAMILGITSSVFAGIPYEYWKYQKPFEQAVETKNDEQTIKIGTEITALFKDLPLDNDKAGILYAAYEKMYPVYEQLGEYDKAIDCLKAMIPYGEYLKFEDGVKLAKERVNKIDPMTEVYALTQKTSAVPYYQAKNEPQYGTYYGRVQSESADPAAEDESIVSFYIECLQDNIMDYDSLIRPYADGNKVIHIALNMPEENDSLKKVVSSSADEYLETAMDYIASLNCPVLLRIGGEMDVWTNLADPALYKEAYIKIAGLARSKAPNTALVFSPNIVSNWTADQKDYYPGDEYVDWVGVSLYYNKYKDAANPKAGQDFEDMYYGNGAYSHPLNALKKIVDCYGDKKPIVITEGGAGHSITGTDTNLTSYAQSRIKEFYTYVNMVYPQVKGVIYFDNDLDKKNDYVYALNKNLSVKNTYQDAVKNNQGFLKSVGDTSMVYTKAGDYQDNLAELSLYSYCIMPGNTTVTVQYSLDGSPVTSAAQMPYLCTIPADGISEGNHELQVEFKGNNGYTKTKGYTLTKNKDGIIKIQEK